MNEKLQERLPEIIKAVRYVRSLVARASIECRPERYTEDREEWFKRKYNRLLTMQKIK